MEDKQRPRDEKPASANPAASPGGTVPMPGWEPSDSHTQPLVDDSVPAAVQVAIVGDVCIDWVIHERRSDDSIVSSRLYQANRQSNLLPIPGGAWFVGSLVLGKLKSEALTSTTKIHVTWSEKVVMRKDRSLVIPHACLFEAGHLRSEDTLPVRVECEKRMSITATPLDNTKGACTIHIPPGSTIELGAREVVIESSESTLLVPQANLVGRQWELAAGIITQVTSPQLIRFSKAVMLEPSTGGAVTIPAGVVLSPIEDLLLDPANPAASKLNMIVDAIEVKRLRIGTPGTETQVTTTLNDAGAPAGASTSPTITVRARRRLWIISTKARVSAGSQVDVMTLHRPVRILRTDDVHHSVSLLELREPHPARSSATGRVFRRSDKYGITGPRTGLPMLLTDYPVPPKMHPWHSARQRVLVVEDSQFGFTDRRAAWEPWVETSHASDATVESSSPPPSGGREIRVFKCTRYMPKTRGDGRSSGSGNLYDHVIDADLAGNTLLIITSDALRRGLSRERGALLTKMVSWELLLEQFLELMSKRPERLAFADHIIVQFGMTGAIYWRRPRSSPNVDAPPAEGSDDSGVDIVYDVERIEGDYVDRSKFGEIMGKTAILTAEVVAAIASRLANERGSVVSLSDMRDDIVRAMRYGIKSCRRYYDHGFGNSDRTVGDFAKLELPIIQIFHVLDHRDDVLGVTRVGLGDVEDSWSILQLLLRSGRGTPKDVNLDLATIIAQVGLSKALKTTAYRSKASFPIGRFGELTTIDRREIEGLRTVRNIIQSYYRTEIGPHTRPVSIAVFGPPGSGKSWLVKRVVDNIGLSHKQREFIEINLSQAETWSEVCERILNVRDANLHGKLPIVFFDEFDVRNPDLSFKWIQQLLVPMQDGRVSLNGRDRELGRAVFVFAGGIAHSYSDFDQARICADSPEAEKFRNQKGPDFLSRLSGHLDVAGPNPRSNEPGEVHQARLRRALLIRSIVDTQYPDLIDATGRLTMDEQVLRALLRVSYYRHGARSVEAVFKMSVLGGETRFGLEQLPVWEQLRMHLSDDFREGLKTPPD